MPSDPATGQQLYHAEALTPATSLKVVCACVFAIYAVQIGLYQVGVIAIGAAIAGFGAALCGLLVWARQRGTRWAALGLRRPALGFVIAGVLVGMSAWYPNLYIVSIIEPPGDSSGLQKVVEETPLAFTVFGIALVPAVAEEVIFRGVFARALATRFSPVHAIGFSAAVFGLYHLLPAQMISTFCLALALGFLTLRARSAVPAMVAHFLNNTVAVVVARHEVPGLTPWLNTHEPAVLAGTSLLLVSGLALAATRGAA